MAGPFDNRFRARGDCGGGRGAAVSESLSDRVSTGGLHVSPLVGHKRTRGGSPMGIPAKFICQGTVLVVTFVTSCATIPTATPPENYKGPIAETPIIQKGDFWVYERGNSTRVKSTVLAPNIHFPLWVGKTWSFEAGALERGQAADSKAFRVPTRIECRVIAFNDVTVRAGVFGAFQCECQCRVLSGEYRPGCGQSTFWYAPEVRNIIRTTTESTASSLDLVEFRAARPAPRPKVDKKKAPVPP
jgi:hypothetical protein